MECTAKQTEAGRREKGPKYSIIGPRYVLVNLEIRIAERAQKKGEQNRCMKMGMNVHWDQYINTECLGTEIAVPYQFHYADLTIDLKVKFNNIRWVCTYSRKQI
jgi:hypothetical protein